MTSVGQRSLGRRIPKGKAAVSRVLRPVGLQRAEPIGEQSEDQIGFKQPAVKIARPAQGPG